MNPKKRAKKPKQKGTVERLTAKQAKLLEYLLDPNNRFKSVTHTCQEIGISRKCYYEAFQRPRFMDIYQRHSVAMTKHAVGPVINSAVREAVRGSLGHQKLILEMAGVYQEKKTHEISGPGGAPIQQEVHHEVDLSGLSVEELRQLDGLLEKTAESGSGQKGPGRKKPE